MSSIFPRKTDVLPFLQTKSLSIPSSTTSSANSIPATVLSKIYDILTACEKHLGFSFISAGDIRPDGTTILSSTPGRTFTIIKTNYTLNSNQGGSFYITFPLKSLIDENLITKSRPVKAPSGDLPSGNPTPLMLTQSPVYISVKRLNSAVPIFNSGCVASLFPDTNGKTNIAISQLQGGFPFTTGEALQITLYFLGGA